MQNKIEKQVSGKQVLLTLITWIGVSALTGTTTFFALRSIVPQWATTDNQSIVISAEVYFLFLAVCFIVFGGFKGLGDKLNFKFTTGKDIVLVIELFIGVLIGSVIIYFLLIPFIGSLPNSLTQVLHDASDMSRLRSADFIAWFLIIIRACILVPLAEELLFRGLLFGWLRSKFSAVITILITTLLFTAMHYFVILFPVGFLFGLAAGWVREHTQSSLNFVVAHVVNSFLFLAIASLLVFHNIFYSPALYLRVIFFCRFS